MENQINADNWMWSVTGRESPIKGARVSSEAVGAGFPGRCVWARESDRNRIKWFGHLGNAG
jgi:hypothetical protein